MLQNNVVVLGLLAASLGIACDSASADRAPAKPEVAAKAVEKTAKPDSVQADASPAKKNNPNTAADAKADDAKADDPKANDPSPNKGKSGKKKSDPKAKDKSGKSAKNMVAPLPPGGSGAHGDRCKTSKDCGANLACSGLYHNEAGKCINIAKAKLACEGAGHKWGKWGRAQLSYCMKTMSDGGKKCGDSKDCKGKCLQMQGRSGGVCQTHEIEFGCHAELKNGKPGMTRCLD